MSTYSDEIQKLTAVCEAAGAPWDTISPESAARMRVQNKFKTGIEIAQYTADVMTADMAAFDADKTKYTQSLGCWHGFIGQQKMISVKKHFNGQTDRRYLYLSGWMVAALRSDFGPLPDQSMHEKTSVAGLVEELYTFLRQADARELGGLFRALDAANEAGDSAKAADIQSQIDNHVTHVVPIIADIDAGFGNAEATYIMAKQMIEAGACCLQIENQVADEKQCGHQDGKVTVPHADFHSKIRALRYAFLELGVDNGIIVARTDSEGAGLTKEIVDLVSVAPVFNLYDEAWPLRTYQPQYPPAKFVFADEGRRMGVGVNSMVCSGCIVSGGRVMNSILSAGVRVNSYSEVESSILFHDVNVGRHSRLRRVIVDTGIQLQERTEIGLDPEEDRRKGHFVTETGIVIVHSGSPGVVQRDSSCEE